ncbi:MAG: hypothetical protein AAB909_04680 [Patescibacteria group bacterium]
MSIEDEVVLGALGAAGFRLGGYVARTIGLSNPDYNFLVGVSEAINDLGDYMVLAACVLGIVHAIENQKKSS